MYYQLEVVKTKCFLLIGDGVLEEGVVVISCGISLDEFNEKMKILAEILIEPLNAMAEEYRKLAALLGVREFEKEMIERQKNRYELQIKCMSKKLLKMVNNKAVKQVVFRTPRESHRKTLIEEEEE